MAKQPARSSLRATVPAGTGCNLAGHAAMAAAAAVGVSAADGADSRRRRPAAALATTTCGRHSSFSFADRRFEARREAAWPDAPGLNGIIDGELEAGACREPTSFRRALAKAECSPSLPGSTIKLEAEYKPIHTIGHLAYPSPKLQQSPSFSPTIAHIPVAQ